MVQLVSVSCLKHLGIFNVQYTGTFLTIAITKINNSPVAPLPDRTFKEIHLVIQILKKYSPLIILTSFSNIFINWIKLCDAWLMGGKNGLDIYILENSCC